MPGGFLTPPQYIRGSPGGLYCRHQGQLRSWLLQSCIPHPALQRPGSTMYPTSWLSIKVIQNKQEPHSPSICKGSGCYLRSEGHWRGERWDT